MEIRELMKDLRNAKGIIEMDCCLRQYGFIVDYLNLDYTSAVEICYSGNEEYSVGMMLFPEEECLYDEEGDDEENEAYNKYVDACDCLNWYVMVKHTIEAYVYICDEQGEEILGYKDFGITQEKFFELSDRYRVNAQSQIP